MVSPGHIIETGVNSNLLCSLSTSDQITGDTYVNARYKQGPGGTGTNHLAGRMQL